MRLAAAILSRLDDGSGHPPPPQQPAATTAASHSTTTSTTTSVLAALARLHAHGLAALAAALDERRTTTTPPKKWDRSRRRLARALSASLWAAAPSIPDPAAWPTHPWLGRLLAARQGSDDDDVGGVGASSIFYAWLAARALPAFTATLGGLRYLQTQTQQPQPHGDDAAGLVVGHLAAQALARLRALAAAAEEGGPGAATTTTPPSVISPLSPLPALALPLQHAAALGGLPALALRPLLARLRAFAFEDAPRRYGVRLAEHLGEAGTETQPPALAAHLSLLWALLGPLAAAAGAGGVEAEEVGGMLGEVR